MVGAGSGVEGADDFFQALLQVRNGGTEKWKETKRETKGKTESVKEGEIVGGTEEEGEGRGLDVCST